ncbi:MAG: hypothetical protein NTU97_00020 [Candidatus Magasanikbacteria bacterium]|nr:hypothetical protein [Candidatus Magasanikbacteria bacterium]
MKLSFILATNRKPSEYADITINSINQFSSGFDYEICVYSQERVAGENVVWIKEEEQKGPIIAINYLATHCSGDYIIQIVDDHILINHIRPTIDVLESSDRLYKICSLHPGNFCGNPIKGQLCGTKNIDFDVPYYPLCRFPVLHKSVLPVLDNCLYNTNFIYHGADIWLGYYLGIKGCPSFDGPTSVRAHNPTKYLKYEAEDCDTCRLLMKESTINNIPYNFKLV